MGLIEAVNNGDTGLEARTKINTALKSISTNTLFISTTDAVVLNTTDETTIVSTGVGSVIIPASKLNKIGVKFQTSVQGIISDTGNPSFELRVKLGGLTIGDSGANSLGSILNDHWRMDLEFVVRTIGVTGTIMATGGFVTAKDDHFSLVNLGTLVIDTTVDQTLDVTVQWGSANASNTVTCQILEIHEINV